MAFCVSSFKRHENMKYTPNDFFHPMFLESQGLIDQNYIITIKLPY